MAYPKPDPYRTTLAHKLLRYPPNRDPFRWDETSRPLILAAGQLLSDRLHQAFKQTYHGQFTAVVTTHDNDLFRCSIFYELPKGTTSRIRCDKDHKVFVAAMHGIKPMVSIDNAALFMEEHGLDTLKLVVG